MSLIVPSISDILILEFIFGKKQSPLSQTLRLFQNNYVPTKRTVISDLIEVTKNGYNPIILNQSDWTIGTISSITTSTYLEQEFVIEENATIYGYYITVNVDSEEKLLWVERFSNGPYDIPSSGGSVNISLNFGST